MLKCNYLSDAREVWLLIFDECCLPVPIKLEEQYLSHKNQPLLLNSSSCKYCFGLIIGEHISVVVPGNPVRPEK